MWEKPCIDGKKKLKYDAVPTIFQDLVYQVTGKVNGSECVAVIHKNIISAVIINIGTIPL